MIAADVTEIRRAETDRMQLAALVQAAPDAIIARDRDGRIATWNPGAEQMFGRAAEEAIGRNYVELVVPDDERERVRATSSSKVDAGQTRDRPLATGCAPTARASRRRSRWRR